MPDRFETGQVPDDPGHWDALAARVAAGAARRARVGGFDRLARSRTGWIVASLLLAAALGFLMLPAGGSAARRIGAEWARAVAPADAMGRALLLPDAPPPIGGLLFGAPSPGMR